MEKKFAKHVQDVLSHKTPGTSFLIIRPIIKGEKISTKDQQEYWSGVGMLLYLVKHSCPNLVNDGANPDAYKKLLHVKKYTSYTKNFGLKFKPMGNSNKPWEIVCLVIVITRETHWVEEA